jgi:hypothetical protein
MKSILGSFAVASLFFLTLIFTSCKKENSNESVVVTEVESQSMTEESAAADAEYDEVTEIGFTAAADLEATTSVESEDSGTATQTGFRIRTEFFTELAGKLGPCTEVTVSGENFPRTVTINYGDGCWCRDGKFRKGAIVLVFSGPLRTAGSVLTITLSNYYVNRAHIEGIKTITNLSSSGVHKFSVNIEKGKISWPNGRGFSYEGNRVVTQVAGIDTRIIRDDVYEIQGRSKTVYANGVIVVKNTESPLIKKISCKWLVQGIVKIKINERTLNIDFGNGDCDNKASISWPGGEKEITLY